MSGELATLACDLTVSEDELQSAATAAFVTGKRPYASCLLLSGSQLSRAMIATQLRTMKWKVYECAKVVDANAVLLSHISKPNPINVVIVDVFCDENFEDTLDHLRAVEADSRTHFASILLTSPRGFEGRGYHPTLEYEVSRREGYKAGYDLVFDSKFDDSLCRQISSLLLPSSVLWRNTNTRVSGAASNYLQIRTLLGEVTDRFYDPVQQEAVVQERIRRTAKETKSSDDTRVDFSFATKEPDCVDTHPQFVQLQAKFEHLEKMQGLSLTEVQTRGGAIKALEAQLTEARETISTLKAEVSSLSGLLQSAVNRDHSKDRAELIRKRNVDAKRMKQMEQSIKDYKNHFVDLNKERERLEKAVDDEENAHTKTKQQVEMQRKKLNEQQSTIETFTKRVKAMRSMVEMPAIGDHARQRLMLEESLKRIHRLKHSIALYEKILRRHEEKCMWECDVDAETVILDEIDLLPSKLPSFDIYPPTSSRQMTVGDILSANERPRRRPLREERTVLDSSERALTNTTVIANAPTTEPKKSAPPSHRDLQAIQHIDRSTDREDMLIAQAMTLTSRVKETLDHPSESLIPLGGDNPGPIEMEERRIETPTRSSPVSVAISPQPPPKKRGEGTRAKRKHEVVAAETPLRAVTPSSAVKSLDVRSLEGQIDTFEEMTRQSAEEDALGLDVIRSSVEKALKGHLKECRYSSDRLAELRADIAKCQEHLDEINDHAVTESGDAREESARRFAKIFYRKMNFQQEASEIEEGLSERGLARQAQLLKEWEVNERRMEDLGEILLQNIDFSGYAELLHRAQTIKSELSQWPDVAQDFRLERPFEAGYSPRADTTLLVEDEVVALQEAESNTNTIWRKKKKLVDDLEQKEVSSPEVRAFVAMRRDLHQVELVSQQSPAGESKTPIESPITISLERTPPQRDVGLTIVASEGSTGTPSAQVLPTPSATADFSFLRHYLSPDGYYSLTPAAIYEMYRAFHDDLLNLFREMKERTPLSNLNLADATHWERKSLKTSTVSKANIPLMLAADNAIVKRFAEYYAAETQEQKRLGRVKYKRYINSVVAPCHVGVQTTFGGRLEDKPDLTLSSDFTDPRRTSPQRLARHTVSLYGESVPQPPEFPAALPHSGTVSNGREKSEKVNETERKLPVIYTSRPMAMWKKNLAQAFGPRGATQSQQNSDTAERIRLGSRGGARRPNTSN